jgi:hypothetical protein
MRCFLGAKEGGKNRVCLPATQVKKNLNEELSIVGANAVGFFLQSKRG